MSSATNPTGGAITSLLYFCHRCEATVNIVPPVGADPVCPICGDSFVEELEVPESGSFISNQAGVEDSSIAPTSALPFNSSSGSVEIRNPGDFVGLLGMDSTPQYSRPSENPGFDPQLFFNDYIQSIFSGGASIQIMFDGAGGGGGSSAENIGEYVYGPGLEHVVQQLFENDPNRYGTPPASKSAVEALPIIKISEEMVAGDVEAQCAVCKDEFELGDEAMQMPCKHIYHQDCIVPWLELHNSCPVCRFELPTDDPDHQQRVVRTPAAPGGRSGGAWDFSGLASTIGEEERPSGRRTRQRRVRISLPRPSSGLLGNAGGVNDSSSSASYDENFEGRQINGPED
ncbi:hypothetical protein IEQ34_014841 [Dendrobium chrysotoxum]|uniref:RING-type E3 ubiquitin transferase n=1 Tax=Dendrobium chrysotoxum TaxID=161865 RepID=A0AAV7GNB7_DENCH|nr:hypothetical protein IEQ34_014841 [Dendrobium chrysotoxum]